MENPNPIFFFFAVCASIAAVVLVAVAMPENISAAFAAYFVVFFSLCAIASAS
jgi:hypothetical protein